MVICAFVGCSMWDKGISFYRIPAVKRKSSRRKLELSIRRRAGYGAAIFREDLDVKALGKYRVCSRHFLSGKPAALKDDTDIAYQNILLGIVNQSGLNKILHNVKFYYYIL